MKKIFFLNRSSFLAFLIVVTFTSCQKENVQELTHQETKNQALDFRSAVLNLAYGIPVDKADTPESLTLFTSAMENLTDGQRTQLEEIVQTYKAQINTPSSPVERNSSFKNSVETILSAGNNGDYYGYGIASNGNTLFVGAPGEGKTYVYRNNVLVQTLSGPGSFGYQVASSGNWLAVMAGEGSAANDNRVILFQKQGNAWVEHSTLYPNFQFFINATGGDIAMDGNTLAVLGRNLGVSGIEVFKLTGNTWSLETTLSAGNVFWWDLDLHANTIVANGGSNIGLGVLFNPMVYIFEKSGNSWGLNSVPFPQPGNLLARYVAIHNSKIVANTAIGSKNSFIITPSSGTWAVTSELTFPNLGSQGFSQGHRLAIQGTKIVVSYPATSGFSGPGNDANDAAFVFEWSQGAWNLTETLTPSTGGLNYEYGFRVALDGNKVLIGAPAGSSNSGAVFIY